MKARLVTALLAACSIVGAARAAYPERPVRLVIPYAASNEADQPVRLVAAAFSRQLRQPIVFDNKPGAYTTIAAEAVARSSPDGYTLFIAQPFNFGTDAFFMKKLSYNGERDFAPVTQWLTAPLILSVGNALPAGNVQQLIALLKKSPEKYFYSTVGNGGLTHLAAVAFSEATATQAVQVPYRGELQVAAALITGEAHFSFAPAAALMPFATAGKLRALAVTSEKRSAALPALPSVAEGGVAGFGMVVSSGIVGPAGMPAPAISRLFEASVLALKEAAVLRGLAELVMDAAPSASPEAYRNWLVREGARQAGLARRSGVAMD